jgi:hypothetical protein
LDAARLIAIIERSGHTDAQPDRTQDAGPAIWTVPCGFMASQPSGKREGWRSGMDARDIRFTIS